MISGNTSYGLEIDTGATGNLVDGDYIGVDATGDAALGNITGILIATTANTVGGTVAGSGNVIAGNDGSPSFYDGVQVLIGGFTALDAPDDNLVIGNLIGLDAAGATLAGATGPGVFLNSGVGNTIGGTIAAARNVISGNSDGVLVEGGSDNIFEGNYVGTDSSGSVGIGNGAAGSDIAIDGSAGNTVGGTIAAAHNVISGSTAGNGVNIFNSGATGNVVVGNDIGTDASGTIALANQVGINLAITSGNNTIGGATSLAGTGAGNLIYGSSFGGISLYQETTADTIVGNAIVANATGLFLQADTGVQIGGTSVQDRNLISGNGTGVNLDGSMKSLIQGNLIGTDITGTSAEPNGIGVEVESGSTGNTIGGALAGAGNVISGNTTDGVEISGAGTSGNVVAGDDIGTDISGTVALGNGADGVLIDTSASANIIGGTTAAARNVISGNAYSGVKIDNANDNVVEGDFIGTDVTGTVALGNNPASAEFAGGVLLDVGSSGNTIGGLTSTPGTGAGNLISGNTFAGVSMDGAGPNNLVAGNLIGTNVTGSVALGNDEAPGGFFGFGVAVQYSPDNIVGEPGGGNVIAGNGLGVSNGANVLLNQSSGSVVQSNIIGTDITGTIALSLTTYYGVALQFGSYVVGGLTPTPGTGLGNVISGNSVGIQDSNQTPGATVVIEGNIIGADATGEHPVPNRNAGVALADVSLVTVGGTEAGAGNLISGNFVGVYIDGSTATANVVAGNFIGTDITGTLAVANLQGVVIADGASNNTIGGLTTTPGTGAGNVISGNTADGVQFTVQNTDTGATDNLVAGNLIGTNAAGTASLGNGDDGVLIEAGASGNTIGGLTSTPGTGAGNVISANLSNGVAIVGSGTTGNVVAGNIIGLNAAGSESIPGDVVWYKFDGNTYDSVSSVANYAANVTGPFAFVAGEVGEGLQLGGASDVTTPLTVNYSTGVTFDAWFQTSAANGTIAADDGGSTTQSGMSLSVEGGDLVLSGSNGSGTFNFVITGPSVDDGAFHHVAATWTGDTTTGGVKLYLDGVLVGQATATSSIATGSQTFAMGNGFTGVLDEVNVVDRPLAALEVARIYNAGSQGQGLGNRNDGVDIDTSASNNTIGGATASARNVIGGNWNAGVAIGVTGGVSSVGNVVQGDFIGTDLEGMTPVGNGVYGIVSDGASGLIGGATNDGQGNPSPGTAPGNLIAGSRSNVFLFGSADVVAGNLIGLSATGTAPLYPATYVSLQVVGNDDIIGGMSPNDRNIVTGTVIEISIGGSGNQLLNNFVGTDPTGTIGLEHIGQTGNNGYDGVTVDGAGPGTVIGAPAPATSLATPTRVVPASISKTRLVLSSRVTRSARTPRARPRSPVAITTSASTSTIPTASSWAARRLARAT